MQVQGDQAAAAAAAAVKAMVDHATATVQAAAGSMPWGIILFGAFAIFVLPAMIENMEGTSRKRRAAA